MGIRDGAMNQNFGGGCPICGEDNSLTTGLASSKITCKSCGSVFKQGTLNPFSATLIESPERSLVGKKMSFSEWAKFRHQRLKEKDRTRKPLSDPKKLQEYREILLDLISEDEIIDEELGNGRYIAITKENVYIVSKGVMSGSFFGEKVKTFPIDQINSVEVSKGTMIGTLQIYVAGQGDSKISRGIFTVARDENSIPFNNAMYPRWKEIADKINSLIREYKNSQRMGFKESSAADEIEKYYELMKKGIITEEEFNKKKKELLGI